MPIRVGALALGLFYRSPCALTRETRDGRPLLTIETEVNRDTNERVLFYFVRRACRARDFCSVLAALVGPVQNIFSPPYTILFPLSPSPSKLGRQSCWVACLLICVSDSPFHHRWKNEKGKDVLEGVQVVGKRQRVTKRCRLSLLTNSALSYTSPNARGLGGLRGLSQWVQLCISRDMEPK